MRSTSVQLAQIHSFLWLSGFLLYIVPQLLDPFICRWTSRLLLCLGYCKLCWNERWSICIFLNYGWFSQSICPIVGLLCHMVVWGFPGGSDVKNLPAVQETWVWSLDWEDPVEKGMATHSSITAWRIPWTEEAGGLQSMGCKEWDTTEQLTLCTKKLPS